MEALRLKQWKNAEFCPLSLQDLGRYFQSPPSMTQPSGP